MVKSLFIVVDIEDIIGHTDTKVISDQHLAALVRQMAVHANVSIQPLQCGDRL